MSKEAENFKELKFFGLVRCFSVKIAQILKIPPKWHFFHVFLPVSDYISKISSPKTTKSRAVCPFTTNVVLLFENIHKKGQKRSKTGHKWQVLSLARFRLFFGDFVAEGEEIKGRRTVHHE